MEKLALTHFFLVSIFIICVLLDFRANAAFFIEVHDNDGYHTIISLYECNLPNVSPRTLQTGSSALALLPAPTINQDISCDEIGDKQRKRQIYLMTNFFLVLQPQLPNGRQIILGSRPQLPNNIFVGVTIVSGGPADSPPFHSDLDGRKFDTIRQKCVASLHADLLGNENFEGFVQYMNLANFFQFTRAADNMVNRFTAFTIIVENVHKHYMRNVVHAKQSSALLEDAAREQERRTHSQHREQAKRIVKIAARLLTHKLIDPCFVTSYLQQIGQQLTNKGARMDIGYTATAMCRRYCQFLSATLTLSSVRSAVYGRSLTDGRCDGKKCMCEKLSNKFLCMSGPKFVPMVACSNDLRLGIKNFLNFGV